METSVGSATKKLILIKLADNANDKGECYPSLTTIARHCELSRRAVILNLNNLVKDGFITKSERKTSNGNTSNLYTLTLGGELDSLGVVNVVHGGSERRAPGVVNVVHPEPVIIKSVIEPKDICDLFNNSNLSFPKVLNLNPKRESTIKKLCNDLPTIDDWRKYFDIANSSDFLTGKESKWSASFDWLINPANALKVLEGNYSKQVNKPDDYKWAEGLE